MELVLCGGDGLEAFVEKFSTGRAGSGGSCSSAWGRLGGVDEKLGEGVIDAVADEALDEGDAHFPGELFASTAGSAGVLSCGRKISRSFRPLVFGVVRDHSPAGYAGMWRLLWIPVLRRRCGVISA